MSETGLLFLLLYALGLSLALFVRPMYGLYTYVAVFYLHPPSRWWGASLPDLRWSFVAAIFTLIALAVHRSDIRDRPAWYRSGIVAIIILFTMWMWLQAPWVLSSTHMAGTVLFTKYVLLAFLIYSTVDNERDFCGFSLMHVAGCAYFGWLIYVAPGTGRFESVGGPGVDNANTLAMHMGTGLMFASFLLLRLKGWVRWTILATIPLILNGIIQTETRGAFVGIFLGGLATVYLKPKKYRRIFYALSAAAIVGFLAMMNDSFMARMGSMTAAVDDNKEWDNSAASRIEIVKAQLKMFGDHPMGVGHQGTAFLSRDYLEERWLATNSGDRASHNTVMSVLVDQGIPGIILYTVLFFIIGQIFRRLKAMDGRGLSNPLGIYRAMLGGSLVTIFGSGMFAQYLIAEVQIWCLVLLAVLWDLARREQASLVAAPKPDGSATSNVAGPKRHLPTHAPGRPTRPAALARQLPRSGNQG